MEKAVGILGLGCYVPEKVLTNHDLEKIVETSDEWIVERTGIKNRHIAAEGEATSDMSVIAAERALADAGVSPEEIELVIVATASADHAFPSTACLVQDRIGAKNAAAFDLSAGCSGFVYSLGVASQMVKSGLYKKALIIGAETLSGSGGKYLFQPAGGSRRPASHETVDAREHFIHMNGNEVFKFAIQIMGKTAKRVLAKAGLEPADVDLLVPHQANIRIINSAAKRLKMPMEKVWVNVDKYGNTSAASIPIALCEAQEQGVLKKGGTVLLVGFGAGLTWSSIVLKWSK